MASAFMQLLNETFENVDNLNSEKIKKLADETAALLEALQDQLTSGDGRAKEDAKNAALDIRNCIEEQMAKLAQSSGLDYQELLRMSQDPKFRTDAIGDLEKLAGEVKSKHNNKIRGIV